MIQVVSPYDQSIIKEIPLSGEVEMEQALEEAYGLFMNRTQWLPPHKRMSILENLAEIMKNRVEQLTKIAAREGGKPYKDSLVEVHRAINGVKIAASEIANLKGEQVPMGLTPSSENRLAFTIREPIGVVVSISAFNHPLNLIVHQVATAVAAGCPVIIKPASTTPLSCLEFADMLKQAGLPDGWCRVLILENNLAEKLATDKRVNYVSFIGSAKVGWYLRSKLSPGTRYALEHGGAAPVLVEPDADLEEAISALIKGGYYHAGQVCVSVQRVFVHDSISEKLINGMVREIEKLKTGDPLDEDTDVGPLILPGEVDRIEKWVNAAVDQGAVLICGGRISNTCYAPTLLLNPPADTDVSQKEIFGPVVCLYTYSDRDVAIRQANELEMHFQAAVFTKNIDVAMACIHQLNANAVMVNDHTAFRVDWMPFGGRDSSGIGMGGISYTMHEMTRLKLLVIKSKSIDS